MAAVSTLAIGFSTDLVHSHWVWVLLMMPHSSSCSARFHRTLGAPGYMEDAPLCTLEAVSQKRGFVRRRPAMLRPCPQAVARLSTL